MKIWVVSMECAGIIEAGGVKNVTYSLCKEFSLLKHDVTLFIPVYKTNEWKLITDFQNNVFENHEIFHCGKNEMVSYSTGKFADGNFKVVFINHPVFGEKEAVYTYTENESRLNPEHRKGKGHVDTLFSDALFAKSVIEYGSLNPAQLPEIIHCQDASTALVPAFSKFLPCHDLYNKTKSIVTIHNAGPAYHHNYSSMGEAFWYTGLPEKLLTDSLNDFRIEPFLIAHNSGACLTTVSENYAKELSDPFYNNETEGLATVFFTKGIKIKGITNGIDVERYNPVNTKESLLPYAYDPKTGDLEGKFNCRRDFVLKLNDPDYIIPDTTKYGKIDYSSEEKQIYIAYHGRITHQKGLNVLLDSIPAILSNYNEVRFIIMGQGDSELENEIIKLTTSYSGKICFINGYERSAARLTTAVCDFIVLPSFFEPCGLEDFIAQIFGTVPVAHKTGGLNKIINEKNGFLYSNNTHEELIAKLSEVISIKKHNPKMISRIIKEGARYTEKKYLWRSVIKNNYLPFFKEILKNN